jgi:hypothetical protein
MARKRKKGKGPIAALVTVALVLVLLVVLNPTSKDFKAYLANGSGRTAKEKLGDNPIGDLVSGLATGVVSFAANLYSRNDMLLFSTFTVKAGGRWNPATSAWRSSSSS